MVGHLKGLTEAAQGEAGPSQEEVQEKQGVHQRGPSMES